MKHGLAKPGQRVVIEQGLECNRPSRIVVSADRDGDVIVNVRVGGAVVEVARGTFTLP